MKNWLIVLLVCILCGCDSQFDDTDVKPEEVRNTLGDKQEGVQTSIETPVSSGTDPVTPMSAETVLRSFLMARITGDQDALRLHCLDHPELDVLFDSYFQGPAGERLAKLSSQVPIRELVAGDIVNLAGGKLLEVSDSMVNEKLKLFVTNQDPVPFSAHLVDGCWKIDPGPSIAAKKELED